MKSLPLILAITVTYAPATLAQTALAQPAFSQTSLTPVGEIPRTPQGKPDFQNIVWATNFFPVFEATPLAADLVVPEDEAKRLVDTMFQGMLPFLEESIDPEAHVIMGKTDGLPIVRGERRTRLIVTPADGKLPLTPEALQITKSTDTMDGPKDDYEQRPASERCIIVSGAPPIHAVISYNRLRMIQTPEHVVIHMENGDEARIIPFAAEHRPTDAPVSLYGDSIARWEGDTLVIETIRHNSYERVRGLMKKFVVNPDAKVIERYTRVAKNELLYQFTIEDPRAYSAPWLGEFSFFATDTGMYESPCHEHNLSLPNILMGQRVADAGAVEQSGN